MNAVLEYGQQQKLKQLGGAEKLVLHQLLTSHGQPSIVEKKIIAGKKRNIVGEEDQRKDVLDVRVAAENLWV